MVEVTLKRTWSTFEEDLKKLLSNKDKLVEQEGKGNRNKYQIEVQKLKDQMKAYKKGGGEGYVSFGKLLKNVKGQEREGKFDRGAEDKTKKKLRKKMMDKKDLSKKGGVHAGSEADIKAELVQRIEDEPMAKKKKKKTSPGAR
jgi:hypothetical protein